MKDENFSSKFEILIILGRFVNKHCITRVDLNMLQWIINMDIQTGFGCEFMMTSKEVDLLWHGCHFWHIVGVDYFKFWAGGRLTRMA